MRFLVQVATSEADYTFARLLFREYADWLGVNLCFQNFDQELEQLPRQYGPPAGSLLLVKKEGKEAVGCVGVRRFSDEAAELKRMYLRPEIRGMGLGRRLLTTALQAARSLGYRRLLLDTLPQMEAALALYYQAGFRPVEPYYHNPIPETIYLGLQLEAEK